MQAMVAGTSQRMVKGLPSTARPSSPTSPTSATCPASRDRHRSPRATAQPASRASACVSGPNHTRATPQPATAVNRCRASATATPATSQASARSERRQR